jgi:hypothetical protein
MRAERLTTILSAALIWLRFGAGPEGLNCSWRLQDAGCLSHPKHVLVVMFADTPSDRFGRLDVFRQYERHFMRVETGFESGRKFAQGGRSSWMPIAGESEHGLLGITRGVLGAFKVAEHVIDDEGNSRWIEVFYGRPGNSSVVFVRVRSRHLQQQRQRLGPEHVLGDSCRPATYLSVLVVSQDAEESESVWRIAEI